MKGNLLRTLLPLVALFLAAPAGAESKADPKLAELLKKGGDALLAEADARVSNFEDQQLDLEMRIYDGGDLEKTLEFVTYSKGDKRLIRFDEPADVRGMGVLIKGSAIYVRIPGSPKVRRVAGHARKQGMLGSDYAFDDTSMLRLGEDYDAKITGQTDTDVKLTLTRKADSKMSYPKMDILISKSDLVRHHTTFYDDDGTKLKTETRKNPRKNERGHYTHELVVMKDAQRDHRTENRVLKEKLDQGLEDRFFRRKTLLKSL